MHSRAFLIAAVSLACIVHLCHAQRDPIEGRWSGAVGRQTDRPPIAFEFKPDSTNTLRAYLYQFAFHGTQVGAVVRKGDEYDVPDFGIHLVRAGDRLEGRMFFDSLPVSLARVDTLPRTASIPADIPRGPEPAWQTKLGTPIHAPATIRDGVAYVGTTGGMFYAVDVRTGAFVWAYAAGRGVYGGALASDSTVYFACDNGFLIALNRATGTERWRYDLGDARVPRPGIHQVVKNSGEFDFDGTGPTPVIADGVLFVGSGDGGMNAVNASTGERVWRFEGKGKIRGTAVVDGDRIVFGTFDGLVYALDRRAGTEIWKRDTRAPITTGLTQIGDRLIVGHRFGLLAALDAAKGATIWRMQLWGSAYETEATPADGSRFFTGSSDLRRVQYMDATDGRVIWRTDVFGWAWPKPTVTSDRIYMSVVGASPYEIEHHGSLSALDRATGRILWRWPMPEWPGAFISGFLAPPVVAGDRLVVGGLDGSLYAFPMK